MKTLRTPARRIALALTLTTALAGIAPAALAAPFTSAGVQMVGLGTTALPALSLSFGAHRIPDARDTASVDVSEVSLQRVSDAFTPELLRMSTTGKVIPTLSFSIVKSNGTTLVETMRVTLTNASVQGLILQASSDGVASEAVTFQYETIKVEAAGKTTVAPWSYTPSTGMTK